MTNTKPEIIGVCGYKRSGKDEVYQALANNFLGVRRIAFGDPLKVELAKACAVDLEFIEKNKSTFRLGLQWWGTEFRRNLFGQQYWIERSEEALKNLDPDARIVVFTDCRFPNEADFIKQQGGRLWRVLRPGAVINDDHTSETALDGYGYTSPDRLLRNVGTLEELHTQVVGLAVQDFNHANIVIEV